MELNRKSLMVEEAVEEVLDLIKKAAQQIRPAEINPDFEFLIADGKHSKERRMTIILQLSTLEGTFRGP